MAVNHFLPFATGDGLSTPNVMPQSAFEGLGQRLSGFASGRASSAAANKTWRQSSLFPFLLGELIKAEGLDAVDDNIVLLRQNLLSTLARYGGGRRARYFNAPGTYQLDWNDGMVLADTRAGNIILNLPSGASFNHNGTMSTIEIVHGTASPYALTLAAPAGQFVEGGATMVIPPLDNAHMFSSGNNLWINSQSLVYRLVGAEAQARDAQDAALNRAIVKEVQDRDAGDQAINNALIQEVNNRGTADNVLNERLVEEARVRAQIDGELDGRIAAEGTERARVDEALYQNILSRLSRADGGQVRGPFEVLNYISILLEGIRQWRFAIGGDGALRVIDTTGNREIFNVKIDGSIHAEGGGWHGLPGNGYAGQKGAAMVNPDYRIGRWLWNVAGYFEVAVDNTLVRVDVSASDERLKERIAPTQTSMRELIRQVGFIDYAMKRTPADVEASGPAPLLLAGLSAQQVQQICPQWVAEMSDGTLMLNTSIMLTNALKLCQELDAEVVALTAGLATAAIWERTTDAEAEALDALVNAEPVRVRRLFAGVRIDPEAPAFDSLRAAMAKAFGKKRAAALLAP